MPVKPLTDANMISGSNTKKYPNPFFDLANNFLPKNIKTLFQYCKTFFYTNSFLRNVITKLTEYPITELLIDSNESQVVKDKWYTIINQNVKLKPLLIDVGLDYYTYGNAFISASVVPKRFLKCSSCGEEHPIDDVNYKIKNFSFEGTCPECKAGGIKFSIVDEKTKSINNIKFVRWSPEHIDIDWNPIINEAEYYYNIPASVKSKIIKGNRHILSTVPKIFLDSLRKKKKIKLDKNNLFHFKRPTLAEEDMGWGKPIILPALKTIYYLQTLKRGNEAIANEHIIPKKAIYPANTTTLDPYTQMNLGKWKTQMETQIKKWKSDPNHIGVFPIPIGYQELGGNARALLLTPEMKFLEEEIINSLGVPVEFVKGNSSWTGSSVSLRIIENHFLTYRELLSDFINQFIVRKVADYLNYPAVKINFKRFRMSDDIQAKQTLANLNSQGKVSDATLLDNFGIDHNKELKALNDSKRLFRESIINDAMAQAKAQGEAQILAAQYQARSEQALEEEGTKIDAELFQEELSQESVGIPEEPSRIIEKYARELFILDPERQMAYLQELYTLMPTTAGLVHKRLQQMQGAYSQVSATVPQEQVIEATGAQMPVEKSDEDRGKGPTRGEV